MKYTDIKLDVDRRNVAWLTLSREQTHNAMSRQMMLELLNACAVINANMDIRAVVLTGSGEKSFCAGADLGWMKSNFKKSRAERIQESALLADMLDALNTVNKTVIARVNGQAYGGGLGLIAVCDIVISVTDARFALTETRLGLTPANISPYLIECLGISSARRILLNAHGFSATEGMQLGLIHKVVESDRLDDAVEQELGSCLACAPGAVAMTKDLIRSVSRQSPEQNRGYTAKMLADAWESEEARLGIDSFFNKQPPPWEK